MMRMRGLRMVLAVSLGLAGCDCDEGGRTAQLDSSSAPEAVDEVSASGAPTEPEATGVRRRSQADLSEEERAHIRAAWTHIREGRRLGRAGDHAESLEAFEHALAEMPELPAALCEAGWQAFHLESHARAIEALKLGARLARVPNRRAACLYNLGRVLEAESSIDAAAESYRASLAIRPNDTVAERLASLNAPEPTTVFTPRAYASLEELCDDGEGGHGELEACEEIDSYPFVDEGRGAAILTIDEKYVLPWWTFHHLALRNASGVVRLALLGETESHSFDTVGTDTTFAPPVFSQIIEGGKREILVTVTTEHWNDMMVSCEDMGLADGSRECEEEQDYEEPALETVIGCAEIGGAWCCGEFDETPNADQLSGACGA